MKKKEVKTKEQNKVEITTKKEIKNNKYSSLIILIIIGLIVTMATWFIKTGNFTAEGSLEIIESHISILDYFMGIAQTLAIFPYELLFILSIGGFYSVISHLDGYQKIVDKFARITKNNKVASIFVISLIIGLISTMLNNIIYIVAILPLAISILSRAKLNKFVVFSTTFGSALLGMIGPLFTGYGFDNLYLSITTIDPNINTSAADYILINLVVFIFGYLLINMYSFMKLKTKGEIEDKFEVDDTIKEVSFMPLFIVIGVIASIVISFIIDSFITVNSLFLLGGITTAIFTIILILVFANGSKIKGNKWPVATILIISAVIFLLGFVNWPSLTNSEIFTDFHNYIITGLSQSENEASIFANLLGANAAEFGAWGELLSVVFILVLTFVISKTGKMKLNDTIDKFVSGAKIIFYPAILYVLAHAITIFSSWIPISNYFTLEIFNISTNFNILLLAAVGIVYGLIINDPAFLAHLLGTILVVNYAGNAGDAAVVINTVFGFMQYVVPGGILLLMGLEYCGIKYVEWIKYAWKFLLSLLLVIILVLLFV